MKELMLAVLLAGCVAVSALSVCCPDLGCFTTGGHFSHLPPPTCPEEWGGLKLGLYTRDSRDAPHMMYRKGNIPSAFDPQKRTIIVIHGYQQKFITRFKHKIKNAILDKEDANVILVGWGGRARAKWYPNAASATRVVAADVALKIDKLKGAGLKTENLWCIGFSLGAHTCGFIGRTTALQRITGLDPAGPWFDKYHPSTRLGPDCAARVDVIHTDGDGFGAFYGTLVPLGHIDFYVNSGKKQPGCWTMFPEEHPFWSNPCDAYTATGYASVCCSHSRSYKYFIESIKYPGCHVAKLKCLEPTRTPESCLHLRSGVFPELGYNADVHALNGNYYLETRARKPYCLI